MSILVKMGYFRKRKRSFFLESRDYTSSKILGKYDVRFPKKNEKSLNFWSFWAKNGNLWTFFDQNDQKTISPIFPKFLNPSFKQNFRKIWLLRDQKYKELLNAECEKTKTHGQNLRVKTCSCIIQGWKAYWYRRLNQN